MKKEKLEELNSFKVYFTKRILYFVGYIFLYIFPATLIIENLFVLKKVEIGSKQVVSLTWCIAGIIYLIFIAKHFKKKILDLHPSPLKTFLGGIASLIPVTILAAFVQLIQDLIIKLPTIDIANSIWTIIFSITIGLVFQIIDAGINRKYLYDLEINKTAKKEVDIETRRKELIKERETMEEWKEKN